MHLPQLRLDATNVEQVAAYARRMRGAKTTRASSSRREMPRRIADRDLVVHAPCNLWRRREDELGSKANRLPCTTAKGWTHDLEDQL